MGIGRSAHGHHAGLAGMASTAWPFLAGLAVGWSVLVACGRRGTAPADGAVVVLATVAVGMSLRVVAGQGTAAAFIAVALAFLSLFLLGWRLAAAVLARRRSDRHAA